MFNDTNFRSRGHEFLQLNFPKTQEELSEIRAANAVTLRRNKRKEAIQNSRMKRNSSPVSISLSSVISQLNLKSLESIKNLRKITAGEPFDYFELIRSCPKIVSLLYPVLKNSGEETTYEVLWIYANLAQGPHYLIEEISKYIPDFAQFIINGKRTLAEQSCWILGNLAAGSAEKKRLIANNSHLIRALANLLTLNDPNLNPVVCWTLSCLAKEETDLILNSGALNPALKISKRPFSTQVVEALWLVSVVSLKQNLEVLTEIFQQDMILVYKKYLDFDDDYIVLPVIRIIGNGFLFNANLDWLCDEKFFSQVIRIFKVHNLQVKVETLWMISNLFTTCYTETAMEADDSLIKCILDQLKEDDTNLRTEAGIALYNLSEVLGGRYFLNVLRAGKLFLISSYIQNISTVPTWVSLNIQQSFDINLLQASLAFLSLCFQIEDPAPDLAYVLYSDDLRNAIEDCETCLNKSSAKSTDEQTIIYQCKSLLDNYKELNN